jgi:outer membrane receptor protein involved in Fe transport
MGRRNSVRLFAAMLLTATTLLATPAAAQTSLGTLRGIVSDEQRGVLPGATVTARHVATNTTHTTVSGERGQFFLTNLPAGVYDISAELSGFAPTRREALDIRVGQELTVDFTLRLEGLTETVEVRGQTVVVISANTVATVVDQKMIDDLPIISRDFSQLSTLAPGTTSSGASGTGAGTGVSIGGARPTSNSIVVDGASNSMQFYGRQANEFPQDWIQEFQVHSNSFGAEYGQASGGLLNVVTRSGSNAFNGRLYGFFRDAALDQAPFAGRFDGDRPVFLDEPPPFEQRRLGATLGGPILRDRLFFFAGVENMDTDSSEVLGVSNYWRQNGVTDTSVPTGVEVGSYLVKTDWQAGQRNRITFRYTNTDKSDLGRSLSASPLDTRETRYTFTGPLWNVLGNVASTFGNSTFNEFRIHYGRNLPWIISDLAGAGGVELLRRDGAMGQNGRFATVSYPGARFGATSFTGLEGETNLTFINNLSIVKGRHQFKLGAQLTRLSMWMDVEASHKGRWSFSADRLFNINDPASYPDSFSGALGTTEGKFPAWNPSFFVQDTWQVNDSVTLNLGLRYDMDRTPAVLNDLIDPYNARIVERFGGDPPLRKSTVDANNFAPRLGVVWTPTADKRTAIRASSGIYYNQNHFNWTVIYAIETLLAERRILFNANLPEQNPFWDAANPAAGRAALRAFLASSFPAYPDLSLAGFAVESVLGVDPDFKIPYNLTTTGGVTHQFNQRLSGSMDYTFRHEFDAATGLNVNWEERDGTYVIKDPRFGRIALAMNGGFIRYQGLLSRLEYRHSARWQVGASYTLAKTTSNTGQGLGVGGNNNPFDLSEDEGPDDNDRRHNYVFNATALLPLDIQLAGLWVYRSALPYSVSTAFQLDTDPFPDRPEARNSRRGDSEQTVDVRLSKIFRLGSRVSATAFWEVFNLFNTDNFLRYQGSLQSSAFGQPITQLPKQRQQFGFRVDF